MLAPIGCNDYMMAGINSVQGLARVGWSRHDEEQGFRMIRQGRTEDLGLIPIAWDQFPVESTEADICRPILMRVERGTREAPTGNESG